ncbi:nickel pincer cofactor biosynthesis protein LarC [Calderihabitans maritimus]|uniref:Pyridinium-3,5-bisthiocarboxylic acid mononucleotide nickel insertion protein n=1 Tax=Calderihabitans maritimus TaxID=1246530 RepID=A0A1Z5HNJ1_9FIRM|nr:nickel pincer cofactor biosynthesis protein LarC [Calderihabitans maritimus]GAW91018.1 hypothetical protein CHY_1283 [Calderihabitans maritimus]
MKIAYFDCFAGISGDMTLGALIDAGLQPKDLEEKLQELKIGKFTLNCRKIKKHGISATKVDVILEDKNSCHRTLRDIEEIIGQSRLSDYVKETSLKIFRRLAEAEARVHRTTVEEVHFHEVGAVDAIIDVVGAVIGLETMGVEKILASPLHVGTGFTSSMHGTIPVPAPATVELTRHVPVYSRGINQELVTPTGAAIITALAQGFGPLPPMRIEEIGYGAGERDLEIPNLLRLFIGQPAGEDESRTSHLDGRKGHQEVALMLEANLDDMNPEFYDHIMDRLFEKGALDVFLTRVQMKKNRPGVMISVLSPYSKYQELVQVLLEETTTIGVRRYEVIKKNLPYDFVEVETEWGPVRVKVARAPGGTLNVAPEYEECRQIALQQGIPIKVVYDLVKNKAYALLKKK